MMSFYLFSKRPENFELFYNDILTHTYRRIDTTYKIVILVNDRQSRSFPIEQGVRQSNIL